MTRRSNGGSDAPTAPAFAARVARVYQARHSARMSSGMAGVTSTARVVGCAAFAADAFTVGVAVLPGAGGGVISAFAGGSAGFSTGCTGVVGGGALPPADAAGRPGV